MTLTVQLFAAAAELAATRKVQLSVPDKITVAELREQLIQTVPQLTALKNSLLVAVNNQYASNEQQIQMTDEVACFPPVSGG